VATPEDVIAHVQRFMPDVLDDLGISQETLDIAWSTFAPSTSLRDINMYV
jgi:hypothetical protein